MEISKENIFELVEKITVSEIIELDRIPDIDLYMDQILTFFDIKLEGYKRTEDEKLLTKTMINNYSKDGVLPSPVKKKYSKDHMLYSILLYHMKSFLTIDDIGKIFDKIRTSGETDIKEIYENFTNLQRLVFDEFEDKIKENTEHIEKMNDGSDDTYAIMLILYLILEANAKKRLVEAIIDKL